MASCLDTLPIGTRATISGFAPMAPDVLSRLLELGFDEGVMVEKLHAALLGDPLAVRVGSTTVALRRALARAILLA